MATSISLLTLVTQADPKFREKTYSYEFTNRRFYEGDSVYDNNAAGIGYMIIEGGRGNRFIVCPDNLTPAAKEQWIKENQ